jgi:head-tail adaptor
LIGALDTHASLQQAVRTADGAGGFTEGWSELAVIWIAVEAASGLDSFGPDRLESRARYRVTARRRSDIAAGLRLVTPSHTLLVQAVLDDGPRVQLVTLLCEDAP